VPGDIRIEGASSKPNASIAAFTALGPSIAQCPVDLPPRALRRALRWIEGVADPLSGIVNAPASTFGWPLLVACAQTQGDHSQDRQQNPHYALFLYTSEMP
jgi:hypothetical protein